jgi:membrane protein DedA with SNARE-associated domain
VFVLLAADLQSTWWQYGLLFLAVAASWAGVPAVGTAALGAAAVGASQGKLDLVGVIVTATVAGEVGGLAGYGIGDRWGRQLLDRPGKHQEGRKKMVERGERAYAKWGRLAVFFTPSVISGTAKMPFRQFVLWNFIASLAYSLAVAASVYGISQLLTGHVTGRDITLLVTGLAVGSLILIVARRRRRAQRRKV